MYNKNNTAARTLSYRANRNSASPLSDWGHAMFADNAEENQQYGDCWWSVDSADLTDINDLRNAILAARRTFDPDNAGQMSCDMIAEFERLNAVCNDDEFFAMFDPADIVDSAEAYDSAVLCVWVWDSVFEPLGIRGVKTRDGAVVYDPDIISPCDNPIDTGHWDQRRNRWVLW